MLLSIIIRCYNEEQHIGRLLSGIMQQTVQNVEIIVVDSGSTDATLSIVSDYPAKILSIKPEEFSFGRSLNIGCRRPVVNLLLLVLTLIRYIRIGWNDLWLLLPTQILL